MVLDHIVETDRSIALAISFYALKPHSWHDRKVKNAYGKIHRTCQAKDRESSMNLLADTIPQILDQCTNYQCMPKGRGVNLLYSKIVSSGPMRQHNTVKIIRAERGRDGPIHQRVNNRYQRLNRVDKIRSVVEWRKCD